MGFDKEIKRRLALIKQQEADNALQAELARNSAQAQRLAEEARLVQEQEIKIQEALAEAKRLRLEDKLRQYRDSVWGGKGRIETSVGNSYGIGNVHSTLSYEFNDLTWDSEPKSKPNRSGGSVFFQGVRPHIAKSLITFDIYVFREHGITTLGFRDGISGFPESELDENLIEEGVSALRNGRTPQAAKEAARGRRRQFPFYRRLLINLDNWNKHNT